MDEASSIAAFRSKRLEQFRLNLERSIKKVLDDATVPTSSFITSYNVKQLTDQFSENVDWPALCRHHNKLYSGRNAVGSTPLQQMCKILVDSLPHACTAATLDVLLLAILKTAAQSKDPTSSRFLPSQELMLGKITQLLNCSPSSPCKLVFRKVLCGGNLNSRQLNLLVSIVYRLSQDCHRFRNDLVEVMFQVIQLLDSMLKTSISQRNEATVLAPADKQHLEPVQRRVKRQRYALSDLHDEDLCHASTKYFSSTRFPSTEAVVSLKKVLQTNDSSTKKVAANTFDEEAHNLIVRALTRAYKKVVKISASHHHPLRIFATSVCKQHEKNRLTSIQMCGWMKMIMLQPTCPSLRLGLLMSVSLHQPADLATLYWQTYATSKDTIWLRFFSELIVSSRYFDNPQQCWTSTQPLWEHLEASIVDPDPGALAAWAHLLSTRGPIWYHQDPEEFVRRNAICSVQYGDAYHWRLALPKFSMTLQKHAILGLMELSRWDGYNKTESIENDGDVDERSSEDGFQEWPLQRTFTIAGAWSRLMEGNMQASLPPEFQNCLSSPTNVKDLLASVANVEGGDGPKEARSADVPALLEHLNNDIQCAIFSYLDHLDLVRVRAVCKFWQRTIEDDKAVIWHNAYKHRFGEYKLEEALKDDSNVHWFSLFRNKYLMELPLRFKRNITTGYKHHTCNYIGCNFVIKSEKKKAQHEERHIRRIAKRKEMAERVRERQRKRKIQQQEKEQREQERLFVQYLKEEARRERNGG